MINACGSGFPLLLQEDTELEVQQEYEEVQMSCHMRNHGVDWEYSTLRRDCWGVECEWGLEIPWESSHRNAVPFFQFWKCKYEGKRAWAVTGGAAGWCFSKELTKVQKAITLMEEGLLRCEIQKDHLLFRKWCKIPVGQWKNVLGMYNCLLSPVHPLPAVPGGHTLRQIDVCSHRPYLS